ncbi:MAG: hypothetical protein ACKO1F_03275 [Flammeovirgaceae bacterium]
MALHCGCRLGFLDLIYQKRHVIAYTIGLIEEVPIAMCNSDCDFDKGLKIDTKEEKSTTPASSLQAHEINLFFAPSFITLPENSMRTLEKFRPAMSDPLTNQYLPSIFHPPALG